jgi:hypothetical protein
MGKIYQQLNLADRTMIQVAMVYRIKPPLKYPYQQEAIFLLRSRD